MRCPFLEMVFFKTRLLVPTFTPSGGPEKEENFITHNDVCSCAKNTLKMTHFSFRESRSSE